MEKLTLKEALDQGYTKCGTDASGWQHLYELSDLTAVDFEGNTKYFLADKEAQYHLREAKDLAEMIADRISDDYADETGCDDVNDILEEIKKIDFSSVCQKINYVMTSHPYWMLTMTNEQAKQEANTKPIRLDKLKVGDTYKYNPCDVGIFKVLGLEDQNWIKVVRTQSGRITGSFPWTEVYPVEI